ncbi:MAG: transposase [bacterium]
MLATHPTAKNQKQLIEKQIDSESNYLKPILTEYGIIIENNWNYLKELFEEIELIDYVIMPNHFHAIIGLGNSPRWKIKGTATDLGNIIKAFKSKCTNDAKKLGFKDKRFWHKSYHEKIIREQIDFQRIQKYIALNPYNWLAKFNPEQLA